ncbi:MAG: serine/threonine-protein kinase [Planctomycetota bacterium]
MQEIPHVPFGKLVLEAGLATREQLAECLAVVQKRRDAGQNVTLGQVLLERGLLTRQEILRILKSQNKTVMQCPTCGRRYNIVGFRDDADYRCTHDSDRLVPRLSDVGMSAELASGGELTDSSASRAVPLEVEVAAPPLPGESSRSDDDNDNDSASASQSSGNFRVETGYVEGITRPVKAEDVQAAIAEAEAADAAGAGSSSSAVSDATDGGADSNAAAAVATSQPTLAEQYGLAPGEKIIGRIGDFVLTRILGRGGMGDVYLGRNRMIQGLFAIKILSAEKAKNLQYRERFLREARLANRLDHPNVVKVWDVGAIEGYFFIVMEYIDGETLSERVERVGQMPVAEAVAISLQALRGIEAAHAAGIIHRDLKPANVMMRRDGLVKVFDFGLALPTDPGQKKLTLAGQTFGTPHFMSPEQIYNRPVDGRTDLYSMGSTLYYALAGNFPYPGEKALEVLVKRMNEKAIPITKYRSDLPDGLVSVIEQLMSDDPKARYENAYAARKALEPYAVS